MILRLACLLAILSQLVLLLLLLDATGRRAIAFTFLGSPLLAAALALALLWSWRHRKEKPDATGAPHDPHRDRPRAAG